MLNNRTMSMFICFCLLIFCSCDNTNTNTSNEPTKISCFVSILPQAYLVDKIAKELVSVQVLVEPGQSPETYEPKHKQLTELSKAQIFFTIGVPFEKILLKRITDSLSLQVIDTLENIELKESDHDHDHEHEGHSHHHENKDPHVWLDPVLMKTQAKTIANSLYLLMPSQKEQLQKNLLLLEEELEKLNSDIIEILSVKKHNNLWVYHPAYNYFCERYGLKQIAIEKEGKEPSAKELASLIMEAKKQKVTTIFVQQQFMGKSPLAISRELNCQIITIDPLAYNYTENLLSIAKQICQTLK